MVTPPTDSEIRLAKQGAASAGRSARGLISSEDLTQEALLWVVSNPEKVEQWRDEGRHGQNKLRHACKQHCLTIVARERRKKSGLMAGDVFYYTNQMIAELLPYMWSPEDWTTGGGERQDVKGPSRPSEGNNKLAMMCDIHSVYVTLPSRDQSLLVMLHKDGGATYEQVAVWMDVSERTIRRREERALSKMVERLGGEPPWR